MPYTNAQRRERYANDLEYRNKILVYNATKRSDPKKRKRAVITTAVWRKEQPEKWDLWSRNYNLQKFGIDFDGYQQLYTSQNGVCAICSKPETELNRNKKTKALAVDHDHQTGKIRGLLCSRCNTSIGKFDENADLLRTAADYLEKHRQ